MSYSIGQEIIFDIQTCTCGGMYAIPQDVVQRCFKAKGSWHCPYCKLNWGYFESEAERLQKKLSREIKTHQQTFSELQAVRKSLRITESRRRSEKGAKTKLKKRLSEVKKGNNP